MKLTKFILAAALFGAVTLSAQAGIRFGFSVGLPYAAPVVVAAPIVVPAVVTIPAVQTVPVCPAPGYVRTPGYWSVCGYSRVHVPGCWHYRPVAVAYGRGGWYR